MPRYRIEEHPDQESYSDNGSGPELCSIETTFSDDGNPPVFVSGYSAREIAQRHLNEKGGTIWVNSVSRKIVLKDYQYATNAPVYYGVHSSPMYTLIRKDGKVVRAYWPAYGE